MFACSVVIGDFGFTDVVMFHHHGWEPDSDLQVGMDGCLSLTTPHHIIWGLQSISQNVHVHHYGSGILLFGLS